MTREILDGMLRLSYPALTDYLFDRDVLLLGGSPAIDDRHFTAGECEHFVFVQLNHHITRRKQPCDWLIARSGSKMLYPLFATLPEKMRVRVKFISTQANRWDYLLQWRDAGKLMFPFHEEGYAAPNPFHPALEWCNQFWNELGTNPLMGMLALRMILLFPVRSVQLFGFDFFALPNGGKRGTLGCHDLIRQREWLLKMWQTDFRISLEPALVRIIGGLEEQRGTI